MAELKVNDILTPTEIENMELPTPPKHITHMNVQELWDMGITGKGIKVAIIDTGCNTDHSLLKGKIKMVYNFTEDDDGDRKNITDYIGHGTHIAGIIAGDNYKDKVMGIAPGVHLHIYKVISKDNSLCNYNLLAQAIYSAAQSGVDIINISLGGLTEAPQIHEAIKYANELNISVVCSCGNSGDGDGYTIENVYPGTYPEVIEVGALNSRGGIARYSNSNEALDCVAPGSRILSTGLKDEYLVLSGTSQATPMVTGILALLKEWSLKEYERELNEVEIYALLIKHTQTMPNVNRNCQGHGYIRIDMKK